MASDPGESVAFTPAVKSRGERPTKYANGAERLRRLGSGDGDQAWAEVMGRMREMTALDAPVVPCLPGLWMWAKALEAKQGFYSANKQSFISANRINRGFIRRINRVLFRGIE